MRPALGRTNHTSPRYPKYSTTRDSRSRLYKFPTRLPPRATYPRATPTSQNTESSTKQPPVRTRGMVGDILARRIVSFPIHQDGGTALRGRAIKQPHIRRPSPSDHLVEVLKRAHQFHAVPPEFANKADLSYYSSRKVPHRGDKPVLVLHPTPKTSLQYFVAEYIRLLCDPAQRNVSGVYISPKVRSWIESKGYAWQDVHLWVNVLVAKSSDDAVSLLRGGYAKGPTPTWVVLFLLRRERLTLGPFRHLLRFSLGRVGLVEYPDGRHQFQEDLTVDEKTVFLLFLRLLRHAREILPSAIVPLTMLITAKINPRNIGTQHSEVPNEQICEAKMNDMRVKLAHIYNKALKLLSLPSKQNPYASAAHQERAQFEILRRIAEYEPPIPVTEDGYRALINIQLAHVKTDRERLWASLKSKGWPPWKEDRTAMDEDILPEDAISRAGQLLRKMGEAGYPATSSDQAASILTGWDLDGSPTIQTRTIHYPQAHTSDETKSITDLQGPSPPPQEVLDPAIWAARVRSTRTLEEAWACFIAYDVSNAPQDQQVYHVMFEKIVADRRRRGRKQKYARHADMPFHGSEWKEPVPGDSTDVWPVPKSYRDRVDPMLKPPNTKELLDRMTSKGVNPSARCLEFVVETAANYTEAWYAIKHFHGSKPSMLPLLKPDVTPEQAAQIPDGMFKAYILLLTRLWYRPLPFALNVPQYGQHLLIHRALDLLSLKKSNDRKCWNYVLHGLSQHGLYNLKDTSAGIMRDAIETMTKLEVELDQEGFGIICSAFNMRATERENNVKARREALSKITSAEDLLKSTKEIQREWDDHLEHCSADSRYLRTLFNHLVGTEPQKSSEALGGMQIPIPHIMHRYIQSLGIMYDFEGLLSVAEFLKRNTSMLVFNAKYSINGSVRLRLAVVSLRAHLEFRSHVHYGKSKAHNAPDNRKTNDSNNTWTSPGHYFNSNPAAAETLLVMPRHSEEQVTLARHNLDDADARGLGGWPSDEEVHRYVVDLSGMRVQPASPPAEETDSKPLYPNLM